MDAECAFYLSLIIAMIAWPCIKYKYYEWQEKRYQMWYRSNVMLEEWKDV